MSDIGLTWIQERGGADLTIAANDLAPDGGLDTAVYIALFTDRRAEPGDSIPDGTADRRGWWGDAFPAAPGDLIGSRLWLLTRSKQTQAVVTKAIEYAREALQWLLDDKVATRVDVSAKIVESGILNLSVAITRPTGNVVAYRYNYNWAAQEASRG